MRINRNLERRLARASSAGTFLVPQTGGERRALRARIGCGDVVMPYPGAFCLAGEFERMTPRMRARSLMKAIHRIHPKWLFCLYSAAMAHGLQVPDALLATVHVGVAPGTNWAKTKGIITSHVLHGEAPVHADGVPCTGLMATLLDCLCASSFRHGLAIVDSALHYGLVERAELEWYIAEHGRGRHGILQARRTVSCADGASENGGESVVRAIIIELGFLVPQLQVEVADPLTPGLFKRVDFYWKLPDGRIVIGELDGFEKYVGRDDARVPLGEGSVRAAVQAMRGERRREAHLNLTGATVLRFSYADALDTEGFFRLLSAAGVPLRDEVLTGCPQRPPAAVALHRP